MDWAGGAADEERKLQTGAGGIEARSCLGRQGFFQNGASRWGSYPHPCSCFLTRPQLVVGIVGVNDARCPLLANPWSGGTGNSAITGCEGTTSSCWAAHLASGCRRRDEHQRRGQLRAGLSDCAAKSAPGTDQGRELGRQMEEKPSSKAGHGRNAMIQGCSGGGVDA